MAAYGDNRLTGRLTGAAGVPGALNIVFVAPFGLGVKSTVWARTLPLAKTLVQRNHRVTILIPPWDTPQDAGRTLEIDGVALINVSIGGGAPSIVHRLLTQIAQLRPDVVHIVKPRAHAGLVQWWLTQRRYTGQLVLDADEWEQSWAEINQYGWLLSRFLAWQEAWGIRHAPAITVASRWLETRCREYAPQTPLLYLPNGVEAHHEPTRRNRRRCSQILYFTRFVEVAPEWLAEFWRATAAQDPEATLTVAGAALQPGRAAAFKAAIGQLDGALAARVHWPGLVAPEQLAALYAGADIAIFPSEARPLHLAKCSVRLATTLLQGVPVVASAVGEQAHYGANGAARLVDSGASPQVFAQATLALLHDETARREMVERGRLHLAQRYDWSQLGHTLQDFYYTLISS